MYSTTTMGVFSVDAATVDLSMIRRGGLLSKVLVGEKSEKKE